ncbi:MAG: gamma-glutamyl-gamma-aminobutyrate hydrolase family protein [Ilumatobacteraceae bacterium]|jgi:putative glutamine amidotransferase
MTRPLILIVGRYSPKAEGVRGEPFAAGRRYFEAITRAGGAPVMLPPITDLVDDVVEIVARVDGLVLHGGGDIDPRHYGQQPSAEQLYGIVPEHDAVELAVARAAVHTDTPMLAICRGLQVLNVAMGGTLHQHIGSEDHWFAHHAVALDPTSRLAAAVGGTVSARSHCVHHQAIDRVGEGLRVVGTTGDGMVHAVEVDRARWITATQWHPEDGADTDAEQQRLFDALVAASA